MRVERFVAGHEARTRFTTFLAAPYCALSTFPLMLCPVGPFGVLAYGVSLRMREFAIRIALGARERNVAGAVVHDAAVMALAVMALAVMALAGVGIGAFLALVATRPLLDTVYPTAFAEAKALVAAEAVLLLVALAAALEPVRRGVRADPAKVIQSN